MQGSHNELTLFIYSVITDNDTNTCKLCLARAFQSGIEQQQLFHGPCPGLPRWAGTWRNINPPTILIIIQSLSVSSIYYNP